MKGLIKFSILLYFCLYSFLLTGCATITSGTSQNISIETEKEIYGANCKLSDKKGGIWYVPDTPGSVTVRKGDGPMTILCKKNGYKPSTLVVDETICGSTFGNIIAGGGIGFLVDAASGAAQQYPDRIIVWMEPENWDSEEDRIAWRKEKEEFIEGNLPKKSAEENENKDTP